MDFDIRENPSNLIIHSLTVILVKSLQLIWTLDTCSVKSTGAQSLNELQRLDSQYMTGYQDSSPTMADGYHAPSVVALLCEPILMFHVETMQNNDFTYDYLLSSTNML